MTAIDAVDLAATTGMLEPEDLLTDDVLATVRSAGMPHLRPDHLCWESWEQPFLVADDIVHLQVTVASSSYRKHVLVFVDADLVAYGTDPHHRFWLGVHHMFVLTPLLARHGLTVVKEPVP